jgi:outer membrane protein assembly factor BamB
MPVEDTFKVAERLQPFASPVIFQGHAHSEALDRWGRVPVVVTGALYGGTPKSGSYRVVTVRRTEISIKTRDFADPAATFGPAKMIEFSEPGPRIRLITPKRSAAVRGTLAIRAVTQPFREGIMEYAIPGFINWTPLRGEKGTWRGEAAAPSRPGRHLLTVRFRGPAGSTVLAHTRFKVPAARVREAWERDLGSAVQAAPAIWQNLAVVPTRDRGVYALRLDSGRVAWHKGVEHGQIIGRVVSDGASVYYGAGRVIQARSAETGESRWQTVLGGTLIAGLTIGGDRLFAPAGEHQLYCLDRRSGKILWEYAAALPIMMEPATDGRRVYFGAVDGSVRSLEAASGREVWKVQLSAMADNYTTAPFWPPVLAGDKVIISKLPVGKDEDNILALAAANGEIAWTGRAAGAALRLALSPDGGRLYAPCRNGLQCLSTKDGTSVWSRETGVGMSAAMAGGDVVLIRDDHDVGCVEAATGNVLWTYRVCTGPQGTYYGPGAFAVQGNLAVIGTVDGHVIGLTW